MYDWRYEDERRERIMAERTLIQKFGIKPGFRLLVLNAPQGALEQLASLPEGATLHTGPDKGKSGGGYDVVLTFAHNKAEVDAHAAGAAKALKKGGLLWFAYPKQTSKIKTDIHRDTGWDAVTKLGFEGVSLTAIDDMWSAMRYRPAGEIKRTSERKGSDARPPKSK
jgi:hypothetical protein